jgi:hypothetical protein
MTETSRSYRESYELAQQCLKRYTTGTDKADISSGITHARQAITQCERHGQPWVDAMCLLTGFLWMRFVTTSSDEYLEQGIEHVTQTLTGVTAGHDTSPLFCLAGSELHMHRYQKHKDLKDLEQALNLTLETEPIYETRLNMLADALYREYKTTRVRDTLIRAIAVRSMVLDLPAVSESLRCTILGNLGLMLSEDFKSKPEMQTIDAAIHYIRKALDIDKARGENHPAIYIELGNALTLKYSLSRKLEDITAACDELDRGIRLTPDGDPLLVFRKNHKLAALDAWSTTTGDVEVFREAYRLAEQNLNLAKGNDDAYAIAASNLGNLCQKRYHKDANSEHLRSARTYMEEAQGRVKPDSEHFADLCAAQSLLALTLFKQTQVNEELDEAMNLVNMAIAAERRGSAATAEHAHIRGMIFAERAALSGQSADFEAAFAEEEASLRAQLPNSPSKADTLFKLCSVGLALFRVKPEARIIQSSIDYGLRCLEVRRGGPRRETEVFNVLSNAYFARFEVERGKRDIDEGIRIGLRSIRDDEDPHQAEYLTNLASKLRSRAVRYGMVADIDDALLYIRQASDLQSTVPRIAFFVQGTMTMILLDSCRLYKSDEKLTEAIQTGERSLQYSNILDGSRSDSLIHLGNMLYEKYIHSKSPEDLKQAINYGEEAVKDCPADHYKKAMILERLGSWLRLRFEKSGHYGDKARAKEVFTQALLVENAPPIFRVQAGRAAAHLHIQGKEWQLAYNCLSRVVALFPRISPRAFSLEDQQFALSRLTGLAAVAASCALNAGENHGKALQVLESGRGIISSWHISTRSDISDLESSYPDLAKRYLDLRKQLSQAAKVLDVPVNTAANLPADTSLPLDVSHITHTQMHRNIAVELAEIEDEIRSKDDFRDFQMALSTKDFGELARNGSVVVVNVTQLRSDVFLVTSTGVRAIPLPDLPQLDLLEKLDSLFGTQRVTVGVPSSRKDRNLRLRDFLGWLWDHAVKSILTELSLLEKPASHLERLFWVTNGLASYCPFHAAGRYEAGITDNAPNHIISTYATSIRALRYCRERKALSLITKGLAPLVIAMDRTIGQLDLKASAEAIAIEESFKSASSLPPDIKHHPSKEEALAQMGDRRIVHFACHGYADNRNPSESHLLLRDALLPGQPDKLSVAEIVKANNSAARLAYLSACSTAENAVPELLDENIHIAGTFQMVGFTHVIGTLWSVGDRAAVATAASFYRHLFRQRDESDTAIAFALHEAVRDLREKRAPGSRVKPAEDVLTWVPFVHFGA